MNKKRPVKDTAQKLVMDQLENGDTERLEPKTVQSKIRFLSLIILGFSSFLAGCTLSILAPFYSKEAADHGISVTASGAVFAAVFVLQIIFTPLFGKFLKSIGSTRLFIIGVLTSGASNIMFGFLPVINDGSLFLGASITVRSITALGEAAMNTAVYPLARRRCSQESEASTMSMLETMIGCGTTIGPFVGGLLYEYGGFCLPFAICGTLLILAGGLAWKVLDPKEEEEQIDGEVGDDQIPSSQRSSYRVLLKNPAIIVACFVTIATGMSTQWYQPSLEPYVRDQFGMSSFQASLLFIIDGGVYAIITPIIGKLLDKGLDCKIVLVVGSGIICFGYLLLAPALPFLISPSLAQIGLGAAVHGIGMGMNFIGSLTLLTQQIETKRRSSEQVQGMVTSMWITCESLGGFIGAAAGGATFDRLGWSSSCLVVGGSQLLAMVIVIFGWLVGLVRHRKRTSEEVSLLGDKLNTNYGSAVAA